MRTRSYGWGLGLLVAIAALALLASLLIGPADLPLGRALAALGAVPVAQPGRDPENLTAGMLAVIPALVISGTVMLAGARHHS